MANDLTQNPIVLDTAHASNVVVDGGRFIRGIKLLGVGGAAVATIQRKSSATTFWRGACASGDSTYDRLDIPTPGDLILTVATNAVILVYYGPEGQ